MITMKQRQVVASLMLEQAARGRAPCDGPGLLVAIVWPTDEGGAPNPAQITESIRLRAEKNQRSAAIAA